MSRCSATGSARAACAQNLLQLCVGRESVDAPTRLRHVEMSMQPGHSTSSALPCNGRESSDVLIDMGRGGIKADLIEKQG